MLKETYLPPVSCLMIRSFQPLQQEGCITITMLKAKHTPTKIINQKALLVKHANVEYFTLLDGTLAS